MKLLCFFGIHTMSRFVVPPKEAKTYAHYTCACKKVSNNPSSYFQCVRDPYGKPKFQVWGHPPRRVMRRCKELAKEFGLKLELVR